MTERISADPVRLELYTYRGRALIARERDSISDYSNALKAFLNAELNDFGDGGIIDRTDALDGVVDGFEELDAKPGAFAFALRQLDRTGRGVLSTIDIRMFSALAQARLDMAGASAADIRGEAFRRTAEVLEPEGGLSGADVATLILDIAGIFDPTPLSDGASGMMSLFRGEWAQVGFSVAAMVPFVGDTGKILKFAKLLKEFRHLGDLAGDTAKMESILKSLKHADWRNPGKLNEALGTMNRLAGEAARRYRDPKVLQAAQRRGLPTEGPVPFVPPKNWDVNNPPTARFRTPGGAKRGTVDAYGNGWVWDPKKQEWDVQIPPSGKFGTFSPDGRHANISPGGQVTH